MKRRLRALLPSEEKLQAHRGLRWMGPLLRRPWLWQFNRRGVAAGAAIGVFFGFLIPLLQIAAAAGVAVVLRANLPVAAAATLVSNPLTYVPIWIAAYRTGSFLLGEPADDATAQRRAEALAGQLEADVADAAPLAWTQHIVEVGTPLAAGLAVFAFAGAMLAWGLVHLAWIAAVRVRQRRRRAAGKGPAP